jgi:hypothetical protein
VSCLKARNATNGFDLLMFVAVAPQALIYLSAAMLSGYASGQMIAELARIASSRRSAPLFEQLRTALTTRR